MWKNIKIGLMMSENKKKECLMNQTIWQRALDSLEIESKAIADIRTYLDVNCFFEAVEVLSTCPKIITCASGTSGIAAKKFAHSLCCIELNARFLSPAEAVHGGLGCVKAGDAVVMISRGGKTSELLPIIEVCNKKGALLIGITENPDSPLALKSQIRIPVKIEKESDPLNIMATSSFVVTIALFDALLAAIMEKTGYKLEQFALIHPGGAVGNFLNK
jgi:D-arabinose 5-phosphate isomerase GutQ